MAIFNSYVKLPEGNITLKSLGNPIKWLSDLIAGWDDDRDRARGGVAGGSMGRIWSDASGKDQLTEGMSIVMFTVKIQ